eukprot:TRINITY_DN6131_c0_g1_i1.p1 TRINITY_DN6131_c0_g1~~TRINITY_DN6131_c0_g1_i1.p1  ORF type:complete len:497 (+),score=132.67 TRINITY_DN6131_c0_g1_i1:128-1492(+)
MIRFTILCVFLLLAVVSAGKHHRKYGRCDHFKQCKFTGDDGAFYSLRQLAKKESGFQYFDEASSANVSVSFCRALQQPQGACDAATSVCVDINGTRVSAGRLPNATFAGLPTVPTDVLPTSAGAEDAGKHDADDARDHDDDDENDDDHDDDDRDEHKSPEKDDDDEDEDDDMREHKRPGQDGERKHKGRKDGDDDDRRNDDRRKHKGRNGRNGRSGRSGRKHDDDDDDKRKRHAKEDGDAERKPRDQYGLQVVYANGDVCASDAQTRMSTTIELHCGAKKFEVTAMRLDACAVHITARSRAACPHRPHHQRRDDHDDDDFDEDLVLIPLLVGSSVCIVLTIMVVAVLIARRRRRLASSGPSPAAAARLPGASQDYPAVAYQMVANEPQPAAPVPQAVPSAPMYPDLVQSQAVAYTAVPQFGGQPFVYPAFFAPHPYLIQAPPAGRSINNDNSLV